MRNLFIICLLGLCSTLQAQFYPNPSYCSSSVDVSDVIVALSDGGNATVYSICFEIDLSSLDIEDVTYSWTKNGTTNMKCLSDGCVRGFRKDCQYLTLRVRSEDNSFFQEYIYPIGEWSDVFNKD